MDQIETKENIIRLAMPADIGAIQAYIGREWSATHIYATDEDFFRYEFCIGDHVNGVIAENRETGEIDAILMFYQSAERWQEADLFGGMWSVAKACRTPMLGFKLVDSVRKLTGMRSHSGAGIKPETTGRMFVHVRGQQVFPMKHYYRLNDRDTYRIAVVKHRQIPEIRPGEGAAVTFREFSDIEELAAEFDFTSCKGQYPHKDAWFIDHRYFRHPVYRYMVCGIEKGGICGALLIMRIVDAAGAKALRLIDFLGDESLLAENGAALQQRMDAYDCEYADFYEYGLDDTVLGAMGLILLSEDDTNIIPNHFEPFEQTNQTLLCHSSLEHVRIFKGDGDQDRPNYRTVSEDDG